MATLRTVRVKSGAQMSGPNVVVSSRELSAIVQCADDLEASELLRKPDVAVEGHWSNGSLRRWIRGIIQRQIPSGTALLLPSGRLVRRMPKSVLEAFGKLDSDSVYKRFFTFKKTLSDSEVRQLTEVDPNRVAALVATQGSELIGGARYIIDAQRNSAELAFVTGADHCRRGVASMLLRHLIVLARRQRLEALEAEVLAENGAMLTVFRRSGLPMQTQIAGNTVHVTLKLAQA